MEAIDWVIIGALVAVCAVLVVVMTALRPPAATERDAPEEFLVPIRTSDGGLVIQAPGGGGEPVFELAPLKAGTLATLAGRRPVKFEPSPSGPAALLAALISYLPMTEKQTVYVVKFRPQVEATWDALKLRLVETSNGTMATARGTNGQFAANARLTKKQISQLSNAQLLSALAVVGVVMHKLDEISDAVARIEIKLDEIAQRLQDDDHGELQSAEALVEVLSSLLSRGTVPDQLALELAIARQRVDAIYFSRQRFVDRFRLRIEHLQHEEEERKGEKARAWARGTTREFSQREALTEETLLYARAMVNRAQLAFCTAGVIALQDGIDEAMIVLRQAETELTTSFAALDDLLGDLAVERPKWAWVPFNDRREVHDTARSLAALFANEVAPLLPRRTGPVLEFSITTELSAEPTAQVLGPSADSDSFGEPG